MPVCGFAFSSAADNWMGKLFHPAVNFSSSLEMLSKITAIVWSCLNCAYRRAVRWHCFLLLIITCQSDHLPSVITNSHLDPKSFSMRMTALQGSAVMKQILATCCTLLPNSSSQTRDTRQDKTCKIWFSNKVLQFSSSVRPKALQCSSGFENPLGSIAVLLISVAFHSEHVGGAGICEWTVCGAWRRWPLHQEKRDVCCLRVLNSN